MKHEDVAKFLGEFKNNSRLLESLSRDDIKLSPDERQFWERLASKLKTGGASFSEKPRGGYSNAFGLFA